MLRAKFLEKNMMQAQSNNQITPIFGFGYMRSGTTLLFNILKNHPVVFTRAPEPKLFASLPILRRTYGDLEDDETLKAYIAFIANVARFRWSMDKLNQPLVEDQDFNGEDVQSILRRVQNREYVPMIKLVYDQMAGEHEKKFWYVKSQVVYFDRIFHWIPEARFIEIVRDPRDVLASKKKDKESVWEPGKYSEAKKPFKELEKAYDPIWDSLSWKAEVAAGMKIKEAHPAIIHSVRYEDLVRDPEYYTRDICEFLGIEFYERQLDVPKRNSSLWQNKPVGIGTQSVEKWKRILTPEEASICQFLTRRQLKARNYEVGNIESNNYKILTMLINSIGEFFQRLLNRMKMFGPKFLINILHLYWKKLKKIF